MPDCRPPTSCSILEASGPRWGTRPSIPSGTSLLLRTSLLTVAVAHPFAHRAKRSHPAIELVGAALVENRFARALFGTREERTDHHSRGARGERLDDIAGEPDSAIGDQRNVARLGDRDAIHDRGNLRHADARDHPCRANRVRGPYRPGARRRPRRSAPWRPRRWRRCRRPRRYRAGRAWSRAARRSRFASGRARYRCRAHRRRRVRRAAARSSRSGPTPIAAPTRSRPIVSLLECGWRVALSISLTVMRPRRRLCSSTSGSFSMRCACRISLASSRPMPGRAVITRVVITSRTGRSRRFSKRRSRLVRMPTRRPSATTGKPEMPWRSMIASASPIFCSGCTVTGSAIIPLSYFFTAATSAACRSIERLRWIKPRPPICAIAIAVRDSVTVSIGLETSGIRRRIVGRQQRRTSQFEGSRSEDCGSSSTSSKVSPSRSSGWGIGSLLMKKSPRVSAGFQRSYLMLLFGAAP